MLLSVANGNKSADDLFRHPACWFPDEPFVGDHKERGSKRPFCSAPEKNLYLGWRVSPSKLMSSQNLCICPYLAIGSLDIFKLRQGHARLGLALNPQGSVSLCEEANLDPELQGDTVWLWRQGLEWCQGVPRLAGSSHKLEEARKDPYLPWAFRECMALPTPWFLTSGLQNCRRKNVCGFMLPHLWYFVLATSENSHSISWQHVQKQNSSCSYGQLQSTALGSFWWQLLGHGSLGPEQEQWLQDGFQPIRDQHRSVTLGTLFLMVDDWSSSS